MNRKSKVSLILSTVCVMMILVAQLIEHLESGEHGGIVSTVCFMVALICLMIAWMSYFLNQKDYK